MSTRGNAPVIQTPAPAQQHPMTAHQPMTRMSRGSDGTFVNVPL
jgi:hypothetical protein